ncbi:MAG: RNA polymerase sigma-70 factor [Saprospiraceae bacterium]
MSRVEFKKLFMQYYNVLCNYSFKYTKDLQISEDLVQEIFVKLWNDKITIDSEKNTRNYLFTIVQRKSLEYLRTEKRHQEILSLGVFDEKGEIDNEIDMEMEYFNKMNKIYVSIRQLPPKCSEIFVLSKIDGLPYTQIAKELNISVKTVENQISKAYKLLREMLKNDGDFN